MYNSIENGDYPKWDVFVQIMTNEEAKNYKFDPFDITKVWYHSDYPLIPLGKLVLNKNPVNYFNEVEQVAFAPSNFVPGIGPSPDKLLQGRLFAYEDTPRWRVGANHHQIPINKPKNLVYSYQREGPMNIDEENPYPNYYPNSVNGPEPEISFKPPNIEVQAVINRHTQTSEDVDFEQVREFYNRVLNDEDKAHLISNILGSISHADENIQYRQTALFFKADSDYGTRISEGLGLDIEIVKKLSSMSQENRVKATFK